MGHPHRSPRRIEHDHDHVHETSIADTEYHHRGISTLRVGLLVSASQLVLTTLAKAARA